MKGKVGDNALYLAHRRGIEMEGQLHLCDVEHWVKMGAGSDVCRGIVLVHLFFAGGGEQSNCPPP